MFTEREIQKWPPYLQSEEVHYQDKLKKNLKQLFWINGQYGVYQIWIAKSIWNELNDFEVIYKSGMENEVANALSRMLTLVDLVCISMVGGLNTILLVEHS